MTIKAKTSKMIDDIPSTSPSFLLPLNVSLQKSTEILQINIYIANLLCE